MTYARSHTLHSKAKQAAIHVLKLPLITNQRIHR
jgi:hypothetical protein